MDITDKILAELEEENQSDRVQLNELIDYWQYSIMHLDASDMTEVENELMISEYAYIKLGLILEKVRNQCMWKKCLEKFSDFRSFCQRKVNLTIWQATNAIKSAEVAVKLSFLGFTELPRNASQALKMAGLSIERLGEVWGNVLKNYPGHEITAGKIHATIDPEWAEKQPSKIERAIVQRAAKQAAKKGMELNEYLDDLLGQDEWDEVTDPNPTDNPIEVTQEQAAIVDALDLRFQAQAQSKVSIEPKKIIEHATDTFDRMRAEMFDRYLPKWKTAVSRG